LSTAPDTLVGSPVTQPIRFHAEADTGVTSGDVRDHDARAATHQSRPMINGSSTELNHSPASAATAFDEVRELIARGRSMLNTHDREAVTEILNDIEARLDLLLPPLSFHER
jgi:hypothetical protein